jgi:hypothetical protein
MGIRIYIHTVGQVSRWDAIQYLATGELPEAAFLAHLNGEQIASYHTATEKDKLSWRSNLGPVLVADGVVKNGVWEMVFASEVGIHGRRRSAFRSEPITVSTGGTSREVAASRAYLEAMSLAVSLAETAEDAIG